jgi:hypothetical protein
MAISTSTDYQEARAALFRAAQSLKAAQAQIVSAERFAETGTTGAMRKAVLRELMVARQVTLMARRHVDAATLASRASVPGTDLTDPARQPMR